jgi:hypothetical protein
VLVSHVVGDANTYARIVNTGGGKDESSGGDSQSVYWVVSC